MTRWLIILAVSASAGLALALLAPLPDATIGVGPAAAPTVPQREPSRIDGLDADPLAPSDVTGPEADEDPAALGSDYEQVLDEAMAKGLIEPLEDE